MDKKEKDRIYYIKNREKILSQMVEYYDKNKDTIKKRANDYYQKNKLKKGFIEKRNIYSRKHYIKNREESLIWAREHHKEQRIKLFKIVGSCACNICGFDDWRALQIDHVNGDGHLERKENGGFIPRKKQKELIEKYPQNYQVLCANCNWIKRYENKETAKTRI